MDDCNNTTITTNNDIPTSSHDDEDEPNDQESLLLDEVDCINAKDSFRKVVVDEIVAVRKRCLINVITLIVLCAFVAISLAFYTDTRNGNTTCSDHVIDIGTFTIGIICVLLFNYGTTSAILAYGWFKATQNLSLFRAVPDSMIRNGELVTPITAMAAMICKHVHLNAAIKSLLDDVNELNRGSELLKDRTKLKNSIVQLKNVLNHCSKCRDFACMGHDVKLTFKHNNRCCTPLFESDTKSSKKDNLNVKYIVCLYVIPLITIIFWYVSLPDVVFSLYNDYNDPKCSQAVALYGSCMLVITIHSLLITFKLLVLTYTNQIDTTRSNLSRTINSGIIHSTNNG